MVYYVMRVEWLLDHFRHVRMNVLFWRNWEVGTSLGTEVIVSDKNKIANYIFDWVFFFMVVDR
jgi:hypothetical protein